MSTYSNTEKWSISAEWTFRGTAYTVCADVRDDVLVVQVEDKLAADRWSGQFDAKHIEELTRKTGNFKQFSIFLNMLESAITKSSDSVTLDLLTYADLETLRRTKLSSTSGSSSGRSFTPTKHKSTHSKRYLILTYSVEFDRIHYPLALPYCGPPDPAVLQQTIRSLLAELEKAKKQGHNNFAFTRLKREYDALLQEKEELEEAFESFKQDIMLSQHGAASKEMRILKKVIKNLEEELLKERAKHQKYSSKRNEEFKQLIKELDELRSSERALQCRVKSLTNELAILKRNIRCSPNYRTPVAVSGNRGTVGSQRTASCERQRSSSRERNMGMGNRRRSFSNERRSTQQKLRTPSPGGGRVPRFDPTAYVERKKQRQQEINTKSRRGKLPRSRTNSTENLLRPPKPAGSVERNNRHTYRLSSSRCSSRGSSRASSRRSSVDLGSDEEAWYGNRHRSLKSGAPKSRHVWGSSPRMTPELRGSTTPAEGRERSGRKKNDSGLMDHSAEISEIDARLNALQDFMKRSIDTNKSSSKR